MLFDYYGDIYSDIYSDICKRVFDRTEEMTPEELKRMMAATDYSSYWENNITVYDIDSIDRISLEKYYMKAVSCGRLDPMEEYDEKELLLGLGLMEGDKLTNAGYYLFSNKKPVVLKMAVYVTDERINFADITRIEDNIFNLIGHAFSYVKEHINWRVEAGTDTSRVEVPEIPIDAIREIIVNSFAHADYRAITENEIDITPTQVEIYNPGEFPPNLTPEMFVAQRVKSMPRNKVILNTLYKSKDVEMFGSGFKKTYALCKRYGTKTKYQSDNGGFSFVFYRKDVTINDTVNVTLNMPDTKMIATDVKVLMALKEDPTKTRAEIAGIIGKTIRTVQRSLDKLDSSGKIRRIGSNKTGYWEVFDK